MTKYVFRQKRRINGKSVTARTYKGRYRLDGEFKTTTVALGVTDKQVAQKKLDDIVRGLEQEKAGIVVPKIQRDAAKQPLEAHLEDYLAALGNDVTREYRYTVEKRLRRLFKECGWQRCADATVDSFVKWRTRQTTAASTKNQYLEACSAFFAWLKQVERISVNPLQNAEKIEEKGKQRRKRRTYNDEQIKALLAVAGTFRVGYLAAVHTGFRRSELEAWEWQNLHLENANPHVWLSEEFTKNDEPADLPLHPGLARELQRIKPADAEPTDKVFSDQTLASIYMLKTTSPSPEFPT